MSRRRPAVVGSVRFKHVVDIENLVGSGLPSPELTAEVVSAYLALVPIGSSDLVVVAGASVGASGWAFETPTGWRRIITANGPDAADRALVEEAASVDRSDFAGLVIASGDHAFVPVADRARRAGLHVVQVGGWGATAQLLRRHSDWCLQLPLRAGPASAGQIAA